MEKELLHILQHSLGVDQYGIGSQYRNHFATGPGGKDFSSCQRLTELGFMEDLGPNRIWGGMHCFVVTDDGKRAVLRYSQALPKVSRGKARYQRYLENADMFDSFIAFCRWDADTERTWKNR
jgi:hypothetical protein